MLSPNLPLASWAVGAALLLVMTVLVWRALHRDRREYSRFKRLRNTKLRQRMLRKWVLESFAWHGASALLLILLAWQFLPAFMADVALWPPISAVHDSLDSGGGFIWGAIIGGSVALVVVMVIAIFRASKDEELQTLGDIEALLPRNRAELKYGWLLSINAGVVEEALFRLALPVALFAVTGNPVVAVLLSVILFGAMHAYQGVAGIIGTTIFGLLMMALFLFRGSILCPIIAHILFDLRSLVLIPMVMKRVHLVR